MLAGTRFSRRFIALVVAFCLLSPLAGRSAAQSPAEADSVRLQAVVTFADTVLAEGRDPYRDTPLFADGLHVYTREPIEWVHERRTWAVSNFANQQVLMRVLVGLSELTDEPKYKQAAVETTRCMFDRYQHPNGLLYWGGHRFIDLRTGDVTTRFEGDYHELKNNHPYYELLNEVDPHATERFIKAFWESHVLDWARLDFSRHGKYGTAVPENRWGRAFDDPPAHYPGTGRTLQNTGTELIKAAGFLYQTTGDEQALVWAKRLAGMYVKARHPETHLGAYQYNIGGGTLSRTGREHDFAWQQFGPEFGEIALMSNMLRSGYGFSAIYCYDAAVRMHLYETFGDKLEEFMDATRIGLRAVAEHAYEPDTNQLHPMWTDGTRLTPDDRVRDGYYSEHHLRPFDADGEYLYAYARAYRLTGDEALWTTARHMARGNGLGDIGVRPGEAADVNLDTDNADPLALFALLDIYRGAPDDAYLDLARRVGDNIVERKFHRGLFVLSRDRLYASFDEPEPLALLALEAAIRGTPEAVPAYDLGRHYIHGDHDGHGRTTDAAVIWSQRVQTPAQP